MPERIVHVQEVQAFTTRSGNTRYVLRADEGSEYTTFKENIARQALAAEGRQARIEYHDHETEEAAWKTAVDAAPWLLGDPPPGGVDADEAFEKLQQFKERVSDDIRDDEDD